MVFRDFSLKAVYEAIDEKRQSRDMTWTAVAREVNRFETKGHPIATGTITGLKSKSLAEGDGVLNMLVWLGRSPESFCPGFPCGDAKRFRLRDPGKGGVLRWDTQALHAALDARRQARNMTWKQIAQELGPGFAPGMLTRLSQGGRVAFPGVMRIVRWLKRPATSFTRSSRAGQLWR